MTSQTAVPAAPVRADPVARVAAGTRARSEVPHDSHVEVGGGADRPDPVAVISQQAASRLPELVPIRHGRMLVSPFTFYRGAAAVMAGDLAATPSTGIMCQLSGDAHLSNFGAFASPERRLVFDLNDFDETCTGPWEWDVKRLAASMAVAAREREFGRKVRTGIVLETVGSYRRAMASFAAMGELAVWYALADLADLGARLSNQLSEDRRKKLSKAGAKARTRDSMQAVGKLTALVDGHRRIVADPPLVVPVADLLPDADRAELEDEIRGLLAHYRRSLQPDRRHLFDQFRFVDMARKVVGVGSVGTRCWIVLMAGRDDNDPLLLQVKEAQRSVLADHVGDAAGVPRMRCEGQRVVAGQRLMQAASDIFLGWETVEGLDGQRRDFYVRQLRDWKASAIVEQMDAQTLRTYGILCGWTLARAHARTGDRIAIAAYLGDTDSFDRALVEFAERYADRTESDHATMAKAVTAGRIEATTGV
jgi:uncharacterized protein (DUF2252 family)